MSSYPPPGTNPPGHDQPVGPWGATPPPAQPPPVYGSYGAPAPPPGAPWPGMPMGRPGTVTGGAVLAFIGGGLMAVVGLLLTILSLATDIAHYLGPVGPGGHAFVTAFAAGILLGGILVVVFAAAAFRGKQWGAVALAVMAGLSVVGVVLDLTTGNARSVLSLAWSITSVALLLSTSARAWYRSRATR